MKAKHPTGARKKGFVDYLSAVLLMCLATGCPHHDPTPQPPEPATLSGTVPYQSSSVALPIQLYIDNFVSGPLSGTFKLGDPTNGALLDLGSITGSKNGNEVVLDTLSGMHISGTIVDAKLTAKASAPSLPGATAPTLLTLTLTVIH